MEHTSSFGYWLRRRRKALDLTQAELARRAICSLDLIQKIEADARRPSRQLAEKLAEAITLDPSEREAFIQAARAQRSVDQLALPNQPVNFPGEVPNSKIPVQLTALLGRAEEVGTTGERLRHADVRLLTLTGSGGVGKTRLAIEVASQLGDAFPHGVFFVDLASIRDPGMVANAVAQTVGIREIGGQTVLERLKDVLHNKHMLLVLDNFEHVLDAAPLVAELLTTAPRLKILATSREALHLRGEQEIAVQPLALPDLDHLPPLEQLAKFAAVALFVERVQAVLPRFQLTATTAPVVAEICARLDGLPLAIELAAARLKLLSPEALLARLSSRLALLDRGPRDLPARQQTIRATIDWSYNLLLPHEQVLFRRLGIFVGGSTLDAINAICVMPKEVHHDLLDDVAALIDKSLLRRVEGPDSTPRFVMLETVREYALELLRSSGEDEHLHHQHALYYVALSEDGRQIFENDDLAWKQLVNSEYDNLWLALDWSQTVDYGDQIVRQLTDTLVSLWWHRGFYHEMLAQLERISQHPAIVHSPRARAGIYEALGNVHGLMGNYHAARQQFEHVLLIIDDLKELDDYRGRSWVFERLGWIAREQGDTETAWKWLRESLDSLPEYDSHIKAEVLNTMAGLAILEEDADHAEALLLEARSLLEAAEPAPWVPKFILSWTLNHLGHVAQLRGDYESAVELHQETLRLFESDYNAGLLWAYHGLGDSYLGLGQPHEAAGWYRRALGLGNAKGEQASMIWCLSGLGSVAAQNQQFKRAARLWGVAEIWRQRFGMRPAPAARLTFERALLVTRTATDEAIFAAAWAAGAAMTLEQAVDYGLERD